MLALWLLLACPASTPERCCAIRCADGHAQVIGAQPRAACDGEAAFICEQRESAPTEVRFEETCPDDEAWLQGR